MIIEQNKAIIGKDVADSAIEKVQEEVKARRGRPKKQVEGGTKEDEQEKQTKRRRYTKTA